MFLCVDELFIVLVQIVVFFLRIGGVYEVCVFVVVFVVFDCIGVGVCVGYVCIGFGMFGFGIVGGCEVCYCWYLGVDCCIVGLGVEIGCGNGCGCVEGGVVG